MTSGGFLVSDQPRDKGPRGISSTSQPRTFRRFSSIYSSQLNIAVVDYLRNMSQVKKQPIVQDVQESAKRQVSEVVRVGEDAVTSGAWMYPIQVSLGRSISGFRGVRLT